MFVPFGGDQPPHPVAGGGPAAQAAYRRIVRAGQVDAVHGTEMLAPDVLSPYRLRWPAKPRDDRTGWQRPPAGGGRHGRRQAVQFVECDLDAFAGQPQLVGELTAAAGTEHGQRPVDQIGIG